MRHVSEFHEEKIPVCTFDTDFSRTLRLTRLFNYMQETTARHCDGTTSGREYLLDHGIFWALARIRIKIIQMPKLGDEILIRTWPKAHDKMFALREYKLTRADRTLALGTSDWILMDMHTRKPQRIAKVLEAGAKFPIPQQGALPDEERPGKIITRGREIYRFVKRVSYNDIDLYGHVNNVRYLEWAFETFSTEDLRESSVRSIQINFTAEAKDGEEVAVTRYESGPGEYVIEGENTASGVKTFQMMLELERP